MSIVARTKAFRYEMVSRVSIFAYLSVLVSLFLDISIFDSEFNQFQMIGIFIIFSSMLISTVSSYGVNKRGQNRK